MQTVQKRTRGEQKHTEHTNRLENFRKKSVFLRKFCIHSGVLRVVRGGSGAKAPPLAARPKCRFQAFKNHKYPGRGKTTRAPPSPCRCTHRHAEGQPVVGRAASGGDLAPEPPHTTGVRLLSRCLSNRGFRTFFSDDGCHPQSPASFFRKI